MRDVDTNAGMAMNSQHQPPAVQPTMDTPIAYYQPIAITPGTIKWAAGGLIAAIWSLYTADYLYRPAKDSDLQAVKAVVEIVRSEQQETRKTVERLVVATDNMSGLIDSLKQSIRVPQPVRSAPRTTGQ